MSRETPLQKVKRLYGSKEKLIEAVVKGLNGLGAGDDDLDERLAGSANSKLLRLAAVVDAVKSRYGNRDKLIVAAADAQGKGKDDDYKEKLGGLPLPRLLDLVTAAERRLRRGKSRSTKQKAA